MGKRPNILFLYTDDQRYETIGALGNEAIRTPALDALAWQGVAFTRPYIMGSTIGAVCVCSRATLMTGRTLWHAPHDCPEGLALLPQVMQEAGYVTFGTGKWHNQPASYARGFTCGDKIFFGGMSNHLAVPLHDFHPTGEYRREDEYVGKKFSSELFSDAAVRFLREYEEEILPALMRRPGALDDEKAKKEVSKLVARAGALRGLSWRELRLIPGPAEEGWKALGPGRPGWGHAEALTRAYERGDAAAMNDAAAALGRELRAQPGYPPAAKLKLEVYLEEFGVLKIGFFLYLLSSLLFFVWAGCFMAAGSLLLFSVSDRVNY